MTEATAGPTTEAKAPTTEAKAPPFTPYQRLWDDGSAIQVQTDVDQVVLQQSTAGVLGRGAGRMTPDEARELSASLAAAADEAENYTAPAGQPEAAAPVASNLQDLIRQLGGRDGAIRFLEALISAGGPATETAKPAAPAAAKVAVVEGAPGTPVPAGEPLG